ncbi:VWA domain-containing protein [Paenibacillus sp. CAU 1782]
MGIQVNAPWFLFLLLPWGVYIWWMAAAAPRLTGIRKIAAISTRSLILLLIIALIAGLQPYRKLQHVNVAFVADRSASVNQENAIGAWIGEAWRNKEADDIGGIISVGANPIIDKAMSADDLPSETGYTFHTGLNGGYSDLAKGLQLAGALLRDNGGGRIVLLSDGEENAGDARRSARLLSDAGIPVDVVHLSSRQTRDVSVEELQVPQNLGQGETFALEVELQSTFAGEALIRLYQDNTEIGTSMVQVERGSNRFVMQSLALEAGFHRFRAEVFADGDEQPLNNEAYAFSRISGPPMVLIVEGTTGSSANLEAALKSSAIAYRTIMPEQLSVELAEYAAYDSIILNNVPATRISEKPMEWIGKATSQYGVGLVMLGGDQSFGLGGYFQTPIERALPVYMDLQGKKQMPSLGLVLVIDRSGSMADGPLELAKEAAMRTIELLRDQDTVGVVAFDSSPWWVVEPTKLDQRDEVIEKIKGIQPAGGTEIYSALNEGYKALSEIDAQRKHMILLTDGQSATQMNYNIITDAMNEEMMTLSTVAIGQGSDQALLERLAQNANGRYYYTTDQSTLPAIFSRETVLMSRTYIVDGAFTPKTGEAGDWSRLWHNGLPSLQAYIATTAKELAEVALWSPDGDPVLARWTYGSGRSLAWTSDAAGKWSPDWMTWDRFPAVFAEWVKWTFPQFESQPYQISLQRDGGTATVVVESDDAAGLGNGDSDKLVAMLESGGGTASVLELMPVAPGRYEGKVATPDPGAYLAQIGTRTEDAEGASAVAGGSTVGFVVPYAPEYRIGGEEGLELLNQLADTTGGRVMTLEDAAEAFREAPIQAKLPYDWSRLLLIAALLLWLLDIALRRLSVPWGKWLSGVKLTTGSSAGNTKGAAGASPAGVSLHKLRERTGQKRKFLDANTPHDEAKGHTRMPDVVRAERRSTTVPSPERKSNGGSLENDVTDQGRQSVFGAKAQPSQQSPEAQSGGGEAGQSSAKSQTINRLLAAKQKNKR